jgi:hypothetical protein
MVRRNFYVQNLEVMKNNTDKLKEMFSRDLGESWQCEISVIATPHKTRRVFRPSSCSSIRQTAIMLSIALI